MALTWGLLRDMALIAISQADAHSRSWTMQFVIALTSSSWRHAAAH